MCQMIFKREQASRKFALHQVQFQSLTSSNSPWQKNLCRNLEEYLNSVLPVVHRNLAMEISIYFPRQTLFCVKSAKSCCSASSFINSSSFCEIANCWQLCYKVDNNQLTRHANNDAFREGSTLMPAGAQPQFSKVNPNQNW